MDYQLLVCTETGLWLNAWLIYLRWEKEEPHAWRRLLFIYGDARGASVTAVCRSQLSCRSTLLLFSICKVCKISSFLSSQKRPVPSDHSESLTPKKQRLLDQNMPLQSPSNGYLSSSMSRSSSAHGNTSLQRGSSTAQQSPDGLYQQNNLGESNSVPKPEPAQQPSFSPKHPRTEPEICTDQQLANGQHKKKSKKHKEKERERLKPEWVETSPDLKQNQKNINGGLKGLKLKFWCRGAKCDPGPQNQSEIKRVYL